MANSIVASSFWANVKDYGASGDGLTDDLIAIQSAINTNFPVYFPAGTYMVSNKIVKGSGTVLTLKGDDASIKAMSSFPAGATIQHGVLQLTGLTSLHIENITVDGNRAAVSAAISTGNWTNYIMGFSVYNSSNVTIFNCRSMNSPSMAFQINTCNNVSIQGCSVANAMYHGIRVDFGTRSIIAGNYIVGIGNQGTDTTKVGIGISAAASPNITINDNYISNSSDTGLKTEGCDEVIMDGNTVINSFKDGIKIENLHDGTAGQPDTQIVYRAKIINNTVNKILIGRSDGSCLIQLYGVQDGIVANNTIIGGGKTGQEDGIQVDQNNNISPVISRNIIVANNIIRDANRFMLINKAENVTIDSNICENVVAPSAGNTYSGLQIDGVTNLKLTNNLVKRNGVTPVNNLCLNLTGGADFTIRNNQFVNGYNGVGITAKACKHVTFSDNSVQNTGNDFASFYFNGSSVIDKVDYSNNKFIDCAKNGTTLGHAAIRIDTTGLTTNKLDFSNNHVSSNGGNNDLALRIAGSGTVNIADVSNFLYAWSGTAFGAPLYSGLSKTIIGLKLAAAPTTGTWAVGDKVENSSPAASGFIGFVCVAAGTPGTWKTYGAISV